MESIAPYGFRTPPQGSTAAQLVDVVVLACGACGEMAPLAFSETAKAMLRICNRPLIWYCLAPWIQAGFHTFYICVEEDYAAIHTYLHQVFAGSSITIYFVPVAPQAVRAGGEGEGEGGPVTTRDALRSFLQFKDRLRDAAYADTSAASEGGSGGRTQRSAAPLRADPAVALERRDVILLRGDTILSHVDLESFVKQFYTSLSSVTLLMMRPTTSTTSPYAKELKAKKAATASASSHGAKGKGGGSKPNAPVSSSQKKPEDTVQPFEYPYSYVVYEDETERDAEWNRERWTKERCRVEALDHTSQAVLNAAMVNSSEAIRTPLPPRHAATASSWGLPPTPGGGPGPTRSPLSATPMTTSSPLRPSGHPFHGVTSGHHRTSGASAAAALLPGMAVYPPHLHRLHVLLSNKDALVAAQMAGEPDLRLNVTLPYSARRPRLKFERGVVNPHVYLMRHWVLEYIVQSGGERQKDNPDAAEEPNVWEMDGKGEDVLGNIILPMLARSQHTTINRSKRTYLTPENRLHYRIPRHWLFEGAGRTKLNVLNAHSDLHHGFLPEKSDALRVFMLLLNEHPQSLRRVYCINTLENYKAATSEIVACRAAIAANPRAGVLSLLPKDIAIAIAAASAAASPHVDPLALSHSPAGDRGSEWHLHHWLLLCARFPPYWQGLSLLLPDETVTLYEKIPQSRPPTGMYIKDSFVQSPIPLNTFVTRSVIGPDVLLQPGARVEDSVLLQGAEVGAKAKVIGTIVASGAQVEDEVEMVDELVKQVLNEYTITLAKHR